MRQAVIHLGCGGKPHGGPGGPLENSFAYLKSLGLDASEVQFTYGVYLDEEGAKRLGEAAKEHKMKMSVHAPYYINLGSKDDKVIERSRERILESARIGAIFGARVVVFHSGFYSTTGSAKRISSEILELADQTETKLAPETMGNMSKFGRLEEVLELSKHKNVVPCVDWCHLHALEQFKTEADFETVLETIGKKLGKKEVGSLHCHFSGVDYGQKGEKSHLPISAGEPDFALLAGVLKKRMPEDMTIICESPELERDSVRMAAMLRT